VKIIILNKKEVKLLKRGGEGEPRGEREGKKELAELLLGESAESTITP
jgi:hypothetical protein